jgi:hypothetical protein
LYEDFRKDNVAGCKEVFDFLGVDSRFEPAVIKANPTRGVRASRFTNWLIYHWDRKEGSIKERAPGWITRPLGYLGGRLVFTSAHSAPLDDALRQELKARFRPDVEALARLIGIDLVKKWGY